MKIQFTVLGEPVAKARVKTFRLKKPRFYVNKQGVLKQRNYGAYTPTKTKIAESEFQDSARKYKPQKLILGAIKLTLRFYMSIPKKPKNALPVTRPDYDNLAKLVCDAMNGEFWKDDAQIVDCHVFKFYSENPRIEVESEEIDL